MTKINKVFDRFNKIEPIPSPKPFSKIYEDDFRSLISVMLSAQTRDEMTALASEQLFAVASTPQDMLKLDLEEIKKLIKPVGFYNRKAEYIQSISKILIDKYKGEIPKTRAELMKLPGIGRKSTDIIMRFIYNEPAIAVDTHVHRLSNRLGLVDTKNEVQTANILENETPEIYKYNAHMWLIKHGKFVCKAINPKCNECIFTDLCDFYNR